MHSCICGSCGSDWSMWYADTHKGASMSAARIYRLLLSGVRWHESHICAAARTSDKVVCTPSVCAVYSRFGRLVYAVTDTAADKPRQAAHRC